MSDLIHRLTQKIVDRRERESTQVSLQLHKANILTARFPAYVAELIAALRQRCTELAAELKRQNVGSLTAVETHGGGFILQHGEQGATPLQAHVSIDRVVGEIKVTREADQQEIRYCAGINGGDRIIVAADSNPFPGEHHTDSGALADHILAFLFEG